MRTLTSRLLGNSPIAIVETRPLFRGAGVRQRGMGSLVRLDSGRVLLAFRLGTGPERRNDGVVMLTHSDTNGETWDEPRPLYAYPGWDCLMMGGLSRLPNDDVLILLGRLQIDLTLGGPEPARGWHVAAARSQDGGTTWTELGAEIRLFPYWTELYGTSNPLQIADGRLLWGCIGTTGRDAGWQAGVVVTGPGGDDFGEPVIIAAAPDREYGDLDLVRLDDGRLLAVIREFTVKDAVYAHSSDEGASWTAIRPTGFKAANIKLIRLRSGAILCAYRDEDPARPGVSCSLSNDGGESWQFIGQLYVAGPDQTDLPGTPCGYPDLVDLGDGQLLGLLHTYPDADGHIDLVQIRLVDRS